MKVFVSWSGDLSKKVAQELKKWLPCIIQSIHVFYSPDDIEKGENWDSKISAELSECNYGIVCLTAENTNAPWINFEAGAIAKTLESKVSALMVDIKPSEIQGPLKRYQATKLEKDDVWQLISDINKVIDNPLSSEVLESTFNAIWDSMYGAIKKAIDEYQPSKKNSAEDVKVKESEAVEEILQLVRKQNVLLGSPEQLFPPEYFQMIQKMYSRSRDNEMLFEEVIRCVERLLNNACNLYLMNSEDEKIQLTMRELQIFDTIESLIRILMEGERYGNPRLYKRADILRKKYKEWRTLMKQD